MHLCSRIAMIVALASVAKCSSSVHGDGRVLSQDHAVPLDGEESVMLRDGRSMKRNNLARLNWGILDSIIDFSKGICPRGKCMSQKDCKNMNGVVGNLDHPDAKCVQGFGVCCIIDKCKGGDVTIGEGGGWFCNPDRRRPPVDFDMDVDTIASFQDVYPKTLEPPKDAVQMKIFIEYMDLLGPDQGDCVNDTLVINGANPGLEIPTLCGVAYYGSSQTLYIDIDNSEGPYNIVVKLACCADHFPEWKIRVDFLMEADCVPRRCLQYHTATSGTIESFNFDRDGPGMMLNDQTYSICFAYVAGFCDIAFDVNRFDLGRLEDKCTNDYVLVGDEKRCGDVNRYLITANATGPIIIGVRSDSINEREEEGFSATYTMMGCS